MRKFALAVMLAMSVAPAKADQTLIGGVSRLRLSSGVQTFSLSANKIALSADQFPDKLVPEVPVSSSRVPKGQNLVPEASEVSFPLEADHGKALIGVMGLRVEQVTGQILNVLPGSDAARAGLESGDLIMTIDGKPYDPWHFQEDCRGVPGEIKRLSVRRAADLFEVEVQLVDSRKFVGFNHYYQECASKSREW